MSEKEKRRFNQMAEEDKKRYELEMANYVPKDQRMAAAMAETAGQFDHHEYHFQV